MMMNREQGKDNTSITDITNVMLDPSKNYENGHSKAAQTKLTVKHDAHFEGIENGYQSIEDLKSSKGKENLSFQEWTAKYHQ